MWYVKHSLIIPILCILSVSFWTVRVIKRRENAYEFIDEWMEIVHDWLI